MRRVSWVEIHRGPHRETEFLAELLEAIDVGARIASAPTSRRPHQRHETTRLLVPRRARDAAETFLERAFAEVWDESANTSHAIGYALGC